MCRVTRRRHAKRLKAKRVNEVKQSSSVDAPWIMRVAVRRVHTATLCSCWMCGSPRKFYGNSEQASTLAERRSNDSMRDDLNEV